jgi:hypothetical protein
MHAGHDQQEKPLLTAKRRSLSAYPSNIENSRKFIVKPVMIAVM